MHVGSNLVSVQERALHSLLPDLARQLLHYSYDAGALIDQLILESPELAPSTQWNPLEEHELRRAYTWVIEAISRASYGEVELSVADGLMEALESRLNEDINCARAADELYVHRRSQHLFRSMAEVSRQAKSLKLGNVLANFFRSHALEIASLENSLALGQWCYSLLRITMRQADRVECLRRVLRERPDLPAKLVGRGRKAAEVAESLEVIRGQLGREERHLRQGLAMQDPFWNIRHRSRSRGRCRDVFDVEDLGGHHARGIDDLGRQGLFGLDDFGPRDDEQELARQAERLMLAQEDAAHESRRMIQLSLGRRHGDRFERQDAFGLGRLRARGVLDDFGAGLGGLGDLDRLGALGGLRGLQLGVDRRRGFDDTIMEDI